MQQFKHHLIKLGLISAGFVFSGGTIAQEVENDTAEPEDVEVIAVRGFRGSLIRAQALKQESTSVVEVITAEDIGKLPDSSIAESLARLPGLAGERRNGRTSGLSVRGFREDYVGTTMNGRELLGIGNNRGVEYDLYPSEIISGAMIYKTPEASLATMGIGGTVDLQTRRPLDSEATLSVSGTLEQNGLDSDNPDFDNEGHRVAFSFSDKFLDDKLGLAVTLASTEAPLQEQRFGVWGYSIKDDGNYSPDGLDSASRSTVLERDTVAAVLQIRPNDNLDITLDVLDIEFSDYGIQRGFVELLNIGSVNNVESGVVTAATTGGFHSVIRTDPQRKEGNLSTLGVNIEYHLDDDWTLELDVAHSESDKTDLAGESYAGVGRSGLPSQGDPTVRDWVLTSEGLRFTNNSTDFSDFNLIKLAGPQAWGGGLAAIDELQSSAVETVGFVNAQDGFLNDARFDEELDTFRLDVTKLLDGIITSINLGVQYNERSKSKENFGAFLTAPTWPFDELIPEQYRRGLADLSWLGLGQVVAYDSLGLLDDGYYRLWEASELEPDRLGDTYTIDEEVLTTFVKADFLYDWDDIEVSGNVGIQYVDTKQRSTGFFGVTGADLKVDATPVAGGADYTHLLPSLNVNFSFGEGHMLRFAAAKTISRPRIDHLKPGGAVRFLVNVFNVTSTDPETGPWLSNSGNPELEPLEADQLDLSYEWYFAEDGYLAATFYYKDLVNWHRSGSEIIDYSQFYIPDFHRAVDTDGNVFSPATFQGVNTFQEGGLTGSVDGIELQANLPLRQLADVMDGFGLLLSASFADGKLDVNEGEENRVPGLSDEVYQATAYYENQGFEFRVAATKRSEYLSETRGGSNSLVEVTRLGETLVDAQISYDFSESDIAWLQGLRISVQGQNLTDEDDVNVLPEDSRLVTRHQHFGRNYRLNLNYKF